MTETISGPRSEAVLCPSKYFQGIPVELPNLRGVHHAWQMLSYAHHVFSLLASWSKGALLPLLPQHPGALVFAAASRRFDASYAPVLVICAHTCRRCVEFWKGQLLFQRGDTPRAHAQDMATCDAHIDYKTLCRAQAPFHHS